MASTSASTSSQAPDANESIYQMSTITTGDLADEPLFSEDFIIKLTQLKRAFTLIPRSADDLATLEALLPSFDALKNLIRPYASNEALQRMVLRYAVVKLPIEVHREFLQCGLAQTVENLVGIVRKAIAAGYSTGGRRKYRQRPNFGTSCAAGLTAYPWPGIYPRPIEDRLIQLESIVTSMLSRRPLPPIARLDDKICQLTTLATKIPKRRTDLINIWSEKIAKLLMLYVSNVDCRAAARARATAQSAEVD